MQTYIDELDLGKWPSIYPDNSPNMGGASPRPVEETTYASPAELWGTDGGLHRLAVGCRPY